MSTIAYAYLITASVLAVVVFGLAAASPWLKRKGQQMIDEVERVKE
ncbi:MAG: hypothetical protein MZW92_07630 [Comamonadaceae bacterium]|nr:hypothetical protein [Comamonadaceae bacterium]